MSTSRAQKWQPFQSANLWKSIHLNKNIEKREAKERPHGTHIQEPPHTWNAIPVRFFNYSGQNIIGPESTEVLLAVGRLPSISWIRATWQGPCTPPGPSHQGQLLLLPLTIIKLLAEGPPS
jgi:hypothetical protein